MDILARNQAHATFFVIGNKVRAAPEVVARMVAEGHGVSNHSWSHTPLVFRPPYGSISPRVAAILPYTPTLWTTDTHDWEAQNRAEILRTAARTHPGSIIRMHSFIGLTVRALPQFLQTLSDRGFTFVTVSQLQGGL